ncbi:MAG TPA: TPM domain-containing protein [Steroidobacteraceae bacterium]|jgi:uncharacterized membrane protein|nr:TPM domain-containing protein [Steroidobacteraceae bacterium]
MHLLLRLLRHLTTFALRTRMLFAPPVLGQIEHAVADAEQHHSGEIRFAIETALPLPAVWQGVTPRERALQVFAQLHVWDTHANNGVLIYVLRADRAVEIIADRGICARVSEAEWQQLCRAVESDYRAQRYAQGSVAAVAGVASLLGRHFPGGGSAVNELPNQPVLL